MKKYNNISDIDIDGLSELSSGCFVVKYKKESIAMHQCNKQVSGMMHKEILFSLKLRYLNENERKNAEI